MDINTVPTDEIETLFETYKDRIETLNDYINNTDDSFTKSNVEIQLSNYENILRTLKNELKLRNNPNYNFKDNEKYKSEFAKVKEETLKIFDLTQAGQKHLYMDFYKSQNFFQYARVINQNSRNLNFYCLINKDFLGKIPDHILVSNKIYVNKKGIIEDSGYSVFLDSESSHYKDSESFHYGSCISKHFDNTTSIHHHESKSTHWQNSSSIHYNNSESYHHDKESKTSWLGNKTYE